MIPFFVPSSRVLRVGLVALFAGVAATAAFAADFNVSSRSIAADNMLTNAQVFQGFGCAGENMSPELTWHNAPAGTQSFAVTIHDPDAPTESGWWHWLIVDIPATTQHLPEGFGKQAAVLNDSIRQIRNDYGVQGFGGACPPEGDEAHRYTITVYALPVSQLQVPNDASAALVSFMLNNQALAKATIVARYGR